MSLGALDGIPVAIKANIAVRGWPYTAGLRFRQQEIAAQDAFLVRRLRAAGAVLLGLTNMDEGALGAEGMNPWYLTTQNPLRAGYCAGGSSSGSAAAVAADLCAFAVGTDTIGSLRIPAAFCGCASIKPSFGLVSVGGIVPVNLRFDHAGPLTRSARDLPLALAALAGYDNACAVSVAAAPVARWPANRPVTMWLRRGLRRARWSAMKSSCLLQQRESRRCDSWATSCCQWISSAGTCRSCGAQY